MNEIIYFQPDALDLVLPKNIVLEIVRKYIKEAQKIDFIDETGGEARVYSIDNKVVLKVQRPNRLRNKTSLEREAFFLKELAKFEDTKAPYVYGYGKYKDIEYICMTKIKGKALKYLDINLEQRRKILFDLGKTLYKIHSLDKKIFLESNLFPVDKTLEDVKNRLNHGFIRNLNKLKDISDNEKAKALNLSKKIIDKIKKIDQFVLLHSNPALSHTFVDQNLDFIGLIDFGDSFISHPIFDIKRWNIKDRLMVLEGYSYKNNLNDNFLEIFNIVNSLDKIIEDLK